jgi:hypothetical protein
MSTIREIPKGLELTILTTVLTVTTGNWREGGKRV